MVITPSPPLPAGTLLGATGFSTVIVNCGETDSTVKFCGRVVAVCEVDGAVPVIVMVYATVVVSDCVVMVADAMAGAVTVAGLTVQTGMSTIVVVVDVIVQARSTVPVKLSTPTVMLVEDVPPGDTALGERGSAARVKVWAEATGKARSAAKRHRAMIPA
jgi:hypothetical protein